MRSNRLPASFQDSRSITRLPLLAVLLVTVAVAGQSPAEDDAATDPNTETAQPVMAPHVVRMQPPDRPPLLREGSFLTGVRGVVRKDEMSGWWRLIIEPDEEHADHPPYSLILMPNSKLQEIEQIVRAGPEFEGLFEITGQTFVFRQRNFLLATHAPRLLEYREPTTAETQEADSSDASASAENDGRETVEDIMRELSRAVGPLRRVGSGASSARRSDDEPAVPLIAEGTRIVARRGSMRRSPGGGWMFIFDADAEGLADPPLFIMPCLLLERMEKHARRSAGHAAMLLSGQIHAYGDRNYILPTVFQIPRERTALRP